MLKEAASMDSWLPERKKKEEQGKMLFEYGRFLKRSPQGARISQISDSLVPCCIDRLFFKMGFSS